MTDIPIGPDDAYQGPQPPGYIGPMSEANQPQLEIVGICHRCTQRGADPLRCKAFPEGIPNEILTGDFIHTIQYSGDGGIRFTPKGGMK